MPKEKLAKLMGITPTITWVYMGFSRNRVNLGYLEKIQRGESHHFPDEMAITAMGIHYFETNPYIWVNYNDLTVTEPWNHG